MIQTRGERNHNPTNLNFIPPARAWNGQIGMEEVPEGKHYSPRFGLYDSDFHGLRAAAKELLKDFAHVVAVRGKCSISDLAHIWAPETDDNDPKSYAATVGKHVTILPLTPINLHELYLLADVLTGFIIVENGRCNYDRAQIEAACRDALGMPAQPSIRTAS